MLSKEDKNILKRMLEENFCNLESEEVERMYNKLLSLEGAYTAFCVYNGSHVAQIGVKYRVGNNLCGKFYYVTEWNNDLIDL